MQRFTLHPAYYNSQADFDLDAPPRLDNDIALLYLDAPVEGVPLQALAAAANDSAAGLLGEPLVAAGWGKVPGAALSDPSQEDLLATELEPVDTSVCQEWFAAYNQSTLLGMDGSELCAGSTGVNSTCSGDSGGPLFAPDGVQVGLTSHGLYGEVGLRVASCGSSGHPTIFTSVAHYRGWIEEQLAAEGLL